LVEHLICNQAVAGSSPAAGTIFYIFINIFTPNYKMASVDFGQRVLAGVRVTKALTAV
jgi:hypothetical protein